MAASFFAFLLAAVALLAIAMPLVQRVGRKDGRPAPALHLRVQQLLDQRDTFLQGIKELENDHSLGNLGDEEHQLLRSDYERQMAGVLKELDAFDSDVDERLEDEIAAARASTTPADQSPTPTSVARTVPPAATPRKAGR